MQNIYHHNNSQTMVWGNDREMMTSDAGGGVYAGMVKAQTARQPLRIELAVPATGAQPGGALCVLSGTGTGECRRVISSSAAKENLMPPAVPKPGMHLELVSCASAYAMDVVPSNKTIDCHSSQGLVFTALCNVPGHQGTNINNCGNQAYREPLMLDPLDAWGEQHGNQYFAFDAQNKSIKLVKSGRCVSPASATVGASIGLDSCNNSLSHWRHVNNNFELLEHGATPSGLCVGVANGGGNQQDVFIIDKPFTYPLDQTSHITILPYTGQIAFNGNDYSGTTYTTHDMIRNGHAGDNSLLLTYIS